MKIIEYVQELYKNKSHLERQTSMHWGIDFLKEILPDRKN